MPRPLPRRAARPRYRIRALGSVVKSGAIALRLVTTGLLLALFFGSVAGPNLASAQTTPYLSQPYLSTLYDVDFSSPRNTVGSEPTYQEGPYPRRTPSELVVFNSISTVVAASNGLTNQPVELSTGTCNYSCTSAAWFATFDRDLPHDNVYTFTGTLVVDPTETIGNGSVGVSASYGGQYGSYVLRFHPDGSIVAGHIPYEDPVGTYTVGQPVSFKIVVDIPNEVWTASVDGEELRSDAFPAICRDSR